MALQAATALLPRSLGELFPGVSAVYGSPPVIGGGRDAAMLIRNAQAKAHRCNDGVGTKGVVTFTIEIAPSGKVTSVVPELSKPVVDKAVVECGTKIMKALDFGPASDGAKVAVPIIYS
ncbi:MAG: hypothetical protein ACXVEF_35580, partial [Polyangiales bacterium]